MFLENSVFAQADAVETSEAPSPTLYSSASTKSDVTINDKSCGGENEISENLTLDERRAILREKFRESVEKASKSSNYQNLTREQRRSLLQKEFKEQIEKLNQCAILKEKARESVKKAGQGSDYKNLTIEQRRSLLQKKFCESLEKQNQNGYKE